MFKTFLRVLSWGAVVLLLAACFTPMRGGPRLPRWYASNGEQIYFTGTSRSGTPITFELGDGGGMGGGMMRGGMMRGGLGCADCHGPDGRGGQVQRMMTSFTAPDIRYTTLTSGEMAHGDEQGDGHADGEAHPAYTDETLKRAITQGVDPAGEPLQWPMPRWRMSEQNLDDLIAYLKTLD